MRSRLETSQHQTNTLASLLQRSGLHGIADASLGEQVAFLIADRAKLMEEIDILNKLNGINGVGKEADLISEIIRVRIFSVFYFILLIFFRFRLRKRC